MYLSYGKYLFLGGADIGENAYNRYAFAAEREIDFMTFCRIKADTAYYGDAEALPYCEELSRLVMELIPLAKDLSGEEKAVTSASNEGYSESYQVLSRQEIKSEAKRLIKTYLSGICDSKGTPLLYSGV